MSKLKKLCKASDENYKEIKEDVKELVSKPKFICKKCLRVSSNKSKLCKPDDL